MSLSFDLMKTVLALVFLLYASWRDFKTREVSDIVWVLFAPTAFLLTFFEIYSYNSTQLPLYGLSFALTAAFALILVYTGGFGGADALALICLALALPFYPKNLFSPLYGEISPISNTIFPVTVFSNSALIAGLSAIVILLYNIFWRWKTGRRLFDGDYSHQSFVKKILVMITGYKVSIGKLKEKWHIYPLEDIEDSTVNPERKLLVFPRDTGRNAIVERLDRAVGEGAIQDNVWATPGLPFLMFLTLGLALSLFLGDIIWAFLRLMLG